MYRLSRALPLIGCRKPCLLNEVFLVVGFNEVMLLFLGGVGRKPMAWWWIIVNATTCFQTARLLALGVDDWPSVSPWSNQVGVCCLCCAFALGRVLRGYTCQMSNETGVLSIWLWQFVTTHRDVVSKQFTWRLLLSLVMMICSLHHSLSLHYTTTIFIFLLSVTLPTWLSVCQSKSIL